MPGENDILNTDNGDRSGDMNDSGSNQASETPTTAVKVPTQTTTPVQDEGSSEKMNGDVNKNENVGNGKMDHDKPNGDDVGEQKLSELKIQSQVETSTKKENEKLEIQNSSNADDVEGGKAGGDVVKKEEVASPPAPAGNNAQTSSKNTEKKSTKQSGGSGDVTRTKENDSSKTPKSDREVKRTQQHKKKEHSHSSSSSTSSSPSKSALKKMKKGVFISYSPDGSFTERRFVCTTVKQFKENNLGEDIWFDKDEQNTDSPSWFSQRMEAVEKCRAAICILSESFLQCPVSVYELRSLLERCKSSSQSGTPSPKVFVIRYENVELPKQYAHMVTQTVDLTSPELLKLSLYERASSAIGTLHQEVESCACVHASYVVPTPERELTKNYKTKKLCRWSINDVQSWLTDLGIREFYRNCFLENGIDGFLLISIMDNDMSECIGIDSRVARKKLLQQIISILEKEHKMSENWHLRARTQRSKPDNVYLSYDPADVQLTQNLKVELKKKNLMVNIFLFCF